MAAFDEPAAYLADFGRNCDKGGVLFKALFDQPDALRGLGEMSAVTREYLLTYATADVTLKRTDVVLVEGVQYVVREAPRQLGDGAFSEAILTKV